MNKHIRLIIGILAVAVCALPALARISVDWGCDQATYQGVFLNDGSDGQGSALPGGAIVQLIYSPVNSLDAIDPSDPYNPQGTGEEVLDEGGATYYVGGSYWNFGVSDYGIGTTDYEGGYVFQRVFNTTTKTETPTQYGDINAGWPPSPAGTSAGPFPTYDPANPPAPTASYLWNSGGQTPYVLSILVPEPMSVGLFFAGVAILGFRRYFRRK